MRCRNVRWTRASPAAPESGASLPEADLGLRFWGSGIFFSSFLARKPLSKKLNVKRSAPVGERLAVAAFGVQDQFLQPFNAPEQLFEQAFQGVEIVVIPF